VRTAAEKSEAPGTPVRRAQATPPGRWSDDRPTLCRLTSRTPGNAVAGDPHRYPCAPIEFVHPTGEPGAVFTPRRHVVYLALPRFRPLVLRRMRRARARRTEPGPVVAVGVAPLRAFMLIGRVRQMRQPKPLPPMTDEAIRGPCMSLGVRLLTLAIPANAPTRQPESVSPQQLWD
jgi:hypothetical protein